MGGGETLEEGSRGEGERGGDQSCVSHSSRERRERGGRGEWRGSGEGERETHVVRQSHRERERGGRGEWRGSWEDSRRASVRVPVRAGSGTFPCVTRSRCSACRRRPPTTGCWPRAHGPSPQGSQPAGSAASLCHASPAARGETR